MHLVNATVNEPSTCQFVSFKTDATLKTAPPRLERPSRNTQESERNIDEARIQIAHPSTR